MSLFCGNEIDEIVFSPPFMLCITAAISYSLSVYCIKSPLLSRNSSLKSLE